MEKKRYILFLLLLCIASSILTFCIGEIVVRVFRLSKTVNSYPWISNPDSVLAVPKFFTPQGRKFTENENMGFNNPYHPELRPNNLIILKGIEFRTNKYGFRSTAEYENIPKKDYKRIIMIGDSVTFGYLEKEEGLFSSLVRNELNKKKKVEVLNFGILGNDTYGNFYVIKKAVNEFFPDMIVYQFALNDIRPGVELKEIDAKQSGGGKKMLSSFKQICHNSALYLFLAERYNYIKLRLGMESWVFKQYEFSEARIKEEFLRFKYIYEFLDKKGIPMIFVFFPDDWQVFSSHPKAIKYQKIFNEFWQDNGWPYLDITGVFKNTGKPYELFLDNCHLSSQGHFLTAKYLLPYIERMLAEISEERRY